MNKRLSYFAATALIGLSSLLFSCSKNDPEYIPPVPEGSGNENQISKNTFSTIEIEGFQVKIRTYVEKTNAAQAALKLMEENLKEVNELIPEYALTVMKEHPIWLEENLTIEGVQTSAAWYNAYLDFLKYYNLMEAKYKCVEITNYTNYVNWSKQNQPYMVLHELCHLYHDLAIENGYDNKELLDAYNHAYSTGMYTDTPYCLDWRTDPPTQYNITGKAYAMNNVTEYFSEICEAYWGKNDYYPFDYWDLKEYDPMGFEQMEKIWGKRNLPDTRP